MNKLNEMMANVERAFFNPTHLNSDGSKILLKWAY